ncbi:hypothetical protein PENTCL1PPCAC_25428 [Pristionchus entomophagus]|uniref:Uncharacterized protein n=1 Tax=Pristionchus entomophagus TaxID=358040 RepID=A0AAV5UA34_9BILA|nr:hypothetical protein PENTCL1PPCAC_25428 [Pristionchus entomophagus]
MSTEEDVVESIKANVASLKYKLDRQEALEKLSEFDMTIDRLCKTKAGSKITDVFRSSRFGQTAKDLHAKWIEAADKELKERWDELKHVFMSKEQLAQLERAQNRYNKKNGIEPVIAKKAPPTRTENPYQKVYQRNLPSLALPGPSTSSASSTPLASPYGSAPSTAFDPDSNFVAYNYSTVSIKRPRGRPRTNFSVKGEGGRKRGRPPTRHRR